MRKYFVETLKGQINSALDCLPLVLPLTFHETSFSAIGFTKPWNEGNHCTCVFCDQSHELPKNSLILGVCLITHCEWKVEKQLENVNIVQSTSIIIIINAYWLIIKLYHIQLNTQMIHCLITKNVWIIYNTGRSQFIVAHPP